MVETLHLRPKGYLEVPRRMRTLSDRFADVGYDEEEDDGVMVSQRGTDQN